MADPVSIAMIGASVLGGASAIKSLTAKPPKQSGPKAMPMPDDQAAEDARRRQIAAVQGRSGRASTILSQSDTLG